MSETPCNCAETYFTDMHGIERRIFHPLHSCEYVKRRNAAIPFAYAQALRRDESGLTRRLDVALFMRLMDQLAHGGRPNEERDPAE